MKLKQVAQLGPFKIEVWEDSSLPARDREGEFEAFPWGGRIYLHKDSPSSTLEHELLHAIESIWNVFSGDEEELRVRIIERATEQFKQTLEDV